MILQSVRAFLAGIIDYAGLFPPAKLPLEKAIRNYAEYRKSRDAWMLGRFIIPAARLLELDAYASLWSSGPPFAFSVLGRGGDTVESFRTGLQADREAMAAFFARHQGRVGLDAFEIKAPTEALHRIAKEILPDTSVLPMRRVVEVPATVPAAFLGELRAIQACAKLRCGGLEAAAFPHPGEIAHVIAACRDHGLTLKFTAGLHHPFRHFDRDLGTRMHGFVNVFGAGILAHALPLTEEQVREIIEDEDASNFGFDEIGFGWKQHHALVDEINAARRQFVVSFGSCSFDEPREDLRALGILP